MTDDLRTRLAAITKEHRCFYRGERAGFGCRCGWVGQSGEHDLHVADALIRALCQEWRIDLGYDGYEFESDRAAAVERLQEIREDWGCDLPPTGVVLQHRYFTEWENDDE